MIPGIGINRSKLTSGTIDGKYMAASAATSSVAKYLFVSNNYGASWSQVGSAGKYLFLSITDDGSKIYSAISGTGVCVSTDFGVTWTTLCSNSQIPTALAISGTGQYLIYSTSNSIYKSSDYGSSWTTLQSLLTAQSASISRTGQYQVYTYNISSTSKALMQSSDYGVTWSTKTYSSVNVALASMSKTGQYRVFIYSNYYTRFSNNYGSSWTIPLVLTQYTPLFTATSGDGKYMMGIGDYSIQSSDYGVTGATIVNPITPLKIAYSETGKYQLIARNWSEKFRLSTDYGVTWTQPNSSSDYWTSLAINQKGE